VGAPGYFFLRGEERRAPRRLARSGVEETIQFFSVGALLFLLSAAVVLGVGLWDRAGLLQLDQVAKDGIVEYSKTHAGRVVGSGAFVVVVAFAFGRWGPNAVYWKLKPTYNPSRSVWDEVLGRAARGERVFVAAELVDRRVVEGYVATYSTDMALKDRELALQAPIYLTLPEEGQALRAKAELLTHVILKGEDIRLLSCRVEP